MGLSLFTLWFEAHSLSKLIICWESIEFVNSEVSLLQGHVDKNHGKLQKKRDLNKDKDTIRTVLRETLYFPVASRLETNHMATRILSSKESLQVIFTLPPFLFSSYSPFSLPPSPISFPFFFELKKKITRRLLPRMRRLLPKMSPLSS